MIHEYPPPNCFGEATVWCLQFLAELSGFNYTQRKQPSADCGPDAWCAHITAGGNTEVQLLDMMKLPDRLAALELAQLSSIVHDMLARNDPKCAAAPYQPQHILLFFDYIKLSDVLRARTAE